MAQALKWSAVVFMFGATVLAATPVVRDLLTRPVRQIRIAGEFVHVTQDELRRAIHDSLTAGFFNVDVGAVRASARQLPWVRDVTVQRVWPDSLTITVTERVAVARWNSQALLENDASMFRPVEGIERYSYTQLQGPQGKQELLLEQYKRMATVFGTLADGIVRLQLSGQGQWQVEFGNGMTLVPGLDLDVAALKDFALTAVRVLGEDLARVERIDLRYANGFAVRWRTPDVPRVEGNKG